ncbi:MAG TPA: ATP-binding protein [Myxococcota bacterium]|nr:ATP-binding protein [Myxococcota bacterium]
MARLRGGERVGAPRRPRGVMAEILASLALVMLSATLVLALVLAGHQESATRAVIAQALAAEAHASARRLLPVFPGTSWVELDPGGAVAEAETGEQRVTPEGRALAAEARSAGATLMRIDRAGEALLAAVPLDLGGRVALARVPLDELPLAPRGTGAVALGVALGSAAVFTAFGATLLRRRVVSPLARLAAAARAIAGGARGARAPSEGTSETIELAAAFNAMTDALEGRTDELEKAVHELREANRSLRSAEAGLARAERLAAVGRLAAGVAHEVGNPMGALLAFLELVSRDPGLASASRTSLGRAREQVERVRTILRQLLDFSRPASHALAPTDLAAVAEEALALVRAQPRYAGLSFEVARQGEPPLALADAGALAQVVLNLVLNAADAVRGRGEGQGRIRISVRAGALATRGGDAAGEAALRRLPDAVECLVEDDGPGIPREDRERVFDPFFTSKPPGEGTGLGLANALRLVEEQGGSLSLLESSSLGGAAFLLRFGAARGAPATGCEVRTEVRSPGAAALPLASEESQANR